jgi:hypothetical protein
MTKDAAYFHWLNNRQGQHGTNREDWEIGWIQIAEQLDKYAK